LLFPPATTGARVMQTKPEPKNLMMMSRERASARAFGT
jgi:hypothetical protein